MKPIAAALLIISVAPLCADIKTQQKSQVQFTGGMGTLMNMFGGKAVKEGLVDTVAVRGNRKITINDLTGRIVDLDEQKVYEIDVKSKSYRVLTFEDIRRQMEQAQEQAKAAQDKRQANTKQAAQPQPDASQIQVDFAVKETGDKRKINGFDCREIVMTITVHQKDQTLEQSGGMVMSTHEWLAPRIESMKEIADFDRRYAEKLNGPSFAAMPSADQMAAAAAMYPMLTNVMGKFSSENVNMDGTSILTLMTVESVASKQQMQQQQQNQNGDAGSPATSSSNTTVPTSLGGLLGGLGRRAAKNQTQQQPPPSTAPGHTTVMTSNQELVTVATDVSDADLAIPAGFKEKKK